MDPQVMRRPPRKRQDDIITRPLVMRVLSSGLLILIGKLTSKLRSIDGEWKKAKKGDGGREE